MFTDRRWDEETGIYYYRARYYDPTIGRFLSQDPLGMVDGPNLYAYVLNNPINFVDPLGLCTLNFGWDDAWDIVEVKCSTKVKDVNYDDVAFQRYVCEQYGLKIRNCFVMHINNQYV